MVKTMPEVSKTLVHLKKRKSSATIQKALVLKADFLHPSSPGRPPWNDGHKADRVRTVWQM